MKITQQKINTKQVAEKKQQSIWQSVINGIVRPPRAVYKHGNFGLSNFNLNGINYTKIERQVIHDDKYRLFLTIFQPEYKTGAIILYAHGNSSSKFESLSIFKFVPRGFSMAAFDFLGCGLNTQTDEITLGHRQSKQIQTLVTFLKKLNYDVILWGRSMGAASCLLYGKTDIIVADSSFKSLKSLCLQLAKAKSPKFVPNCLISCLFPCIFYKLKKDVEQKCQYDMEDIDIGQAVKRISSQTTIIFMSGNNDFLIHHRNSQKLYHLFYGQNKHLQLFDGNHNSKRPDELLIKIMQLIEIQYEKRKQKSQSQGEVIPFQSQQAFKL